MVVLEMMVYDFPKYEKVIIHFNENQDRFQVIYQYCSLILLGILRLIILMLVLINLHRPFLMHKK